MAAINALRLRRTLSIFHRSLSSAHSNTAVSSSSSSAAFIAQSHPSRSFQALFSSVRSTNGCEKTVRLPFTLKDSATISTSSASTSLRTPSLVLRRWSEHMGKSMLSDSASVGGVRKGNYAWSARSGFVDHRVKSKPQNNKKLIYGQHRCKGHNSRGRITSWHRGGGHKRLYRKIDLQRKEKGISGRIEAIEYDPNRSASICLVKWTKGFEATTDH